MFNFLRPKAEAKAPETLRRIPRKQLVAICKRNRRASNNPRSVRVKHRIFKASGKISNQPTLVGTRNEETIDVVIEVAIKLSHFE